MPSFMIICNAFLPDHKMVYMHQTIGFTDPPFSHHVCWPRKSLYGLKQVSRAWFHHFARHVVILGFQHSKTYLSIFSFETGRLHTYFYILTIYFLRLLPRLFCATSSQILVMSFLWQTCDLWNTFLGIFVTLSAKGMFLSQKKNATNLLHWANMLECNPCYTPVDTCYKFSTKRTFVTDPTTYSSIVGGLHYLKFMTQDYVQCLVCQ